jgi:hypothetical protein
MIELALLWLLIGCIVALVEVAWPDSFLWRYNRDVVGLSFFLILWEAVVVVLVWPVIVWAEFVSMLDDVD